MGRIFLIVILTLGVIFCHMQMLAYAEDGPRAKIHMFKYYGAEAGEQQVGVFKNVLKTKIITMIEELTNVGQNFDYLNDLKFLPIEKDLPSSPREISKFWEESHSLQLLSGTIHSKDNVVTVNSSVYLGDLKGSLSKRLIEIEMSISPNHFRSNHDSHSLMTLYALAMDAKRLNLPSEMVALYLGKAHAIVQDLNAELPEVKSLKDAVEKALEELKTAATKRP